MVTLGIARAPIPKWLQGPIFRARKGGFTHTAMGTQFHPSTRTG